MMKVDGQGSRGVDKRDSPKRQPGAQVLRIIAELNCEPVPAMRNINVTRMEL